MVYNINPRSFLRELLIAIVIMFNAICFSVNELMPSVSDFGDVLVIFVILFGTINCLMSGKIIIRRFLLINGVILLWMLGSYVFYGFNKDIYLLLINYLVWGIIISFFMTLEYDVQKTLNIALPIASIILFLDLQYNGHKLYDSMTWTYSVFPCLCVCFTHMTLCKGQLGKWRWLFYIPAILILFRYCAEANRGGWVSLIVLVYLLTAKTKIKKDTKLRNRVLWNVLFLSMIVFSVFFYDGIIKVLYKITTDLDVHIYSIEKMYRGILANDVSNSRAELYQLAWKGFLASPIWGQGIGAFAVNYHTWPHNFVFQLLYEGGILLFLLVMIPFGKIFLAVIKSNSISSTDYAMFVCLFATSVPKILVTSELWKVQGFWLLLAFGMMRLHYFQDRTLPCDHSECIQQDIVTIVSANNEMNQ